MAVLLGWRAMAPRTVSPVDVRVRVVEVALTPALMLARVMALPLDDLQHLVATAYFREARARGLSFRAIARRFDKSLRTITNLARRADGDEPLLEGHRRLGHRRRAVAWLAFEGQATFAQIARAVPDADRDDLQADLEHLIEQGIVTNDGELYRVVAGYMDTRAEDLSARLDALRHLLEGVTMAIHRRFFEPRAEGPSLARVLTFNASREALAKLAEGGYAGLRQAVLETDEAAGDDAVQASLTLTVTEVPSGPGWRPRS